MARRDLETTTTDDVVTKAKRDREKRRGPVAAVALFIRQVIAELRKVVTPTRRELFSYTGVVLVFVVVMMVLVSVLDFVFGWGVGYVFGNGATS
ncbi:MULTISPECIES: preprotein translocase subunit SecE [unclassified Curtobacterium]|uniref:preprotein translocase subunit SecE n=1 Tax=unclassified Curtobacterium TaxID=257496 RepID=UPI000DA81083|nr:MULTISPECIES: preprotein translocase subunit SecE [unclassified Curtobacterium]PZE26519.1 preprotein translocase subunit SecE [Curtobacterium sp. MCBD17_028]PZE74264.1 preprotein translocase subunit SecE [Curtobacterium sp. MCBD17_019]PZF58609.1 preprotein translocase subunit SecE [Curtobacterium sp. MCBD17_034]PZF64341.1 preprotein translocase subunit SecE [Curtobacterium sp. MCBD17_013]PZM34599.1 preprotein translocase subunit SecE [Curtobacterium sp. MCBD17_031]